MRAVCWVRAFLSGKLLLDQKFSWAWELKPGEPVHSGQSLEERQHFKSGDMILDDKCGFNCFLSLQLVQQSGLASYSVYI